MNKFILLTASTLMISGLAPALAADPAWLVDFRKADLNDSEGLSKLELDKSKASSLKPIRDKFQTIDADSDGQVTQSEYEHFLSQTQDAFANKFKQADLNDSGGLSRKELDKVSVKEFDPLKQDFDAIDANKDGQVSLSEYRSYQSASAKSAAKAGAARSARIDQCQPDCGVVTVVDRYKVQGEGSALGAIAGGVAGGVLGNQVGKGTGKTVATVGGAAGGAYVGHQLEKKLKTKKMVKVTVKLDSGQTQDFEFEADKSPFAKGERVQVKDGQLTRYEGA